MSGESNRGPVLVGWARARLRQELGGASAQKPEVPWGNDKHGTFVTWRWHDQRLQGCIGNLGADRAILDDVAHNTVAAGLHDPRAKQLALRDLEQLRVEVSVLSALSPLASEAEIRVGTDGIVIQEGTWKRATFLPIMWEQLPTLDHFMGELKRKAGLPRTFPSAELQIWRYTVDRYE